MRRLFLFSIVSFLLIEGASGGYAETNRIVKGNLVIEGIPDIPQRIIDRRLQYQNIRFAYLQDWDPSGEGILISTRFAETSQFHWVRTPGGARQQITFFNEPVRSAMMNPDPSVSGFLFRKDVGGSELYQIFFYDLEKGNYWMLTDGKSRNGSSLWSNKGDRFAFYTTKRNGRDWDIYIGELNNSKNAVAVLESTGTWIPVDWSPDDSQLLISRYVSASESYYYTLDLSTKKLTQINSPSGIEAISTQKKIAYGDAQWSKDGNGIYLTSDEGSEFQQLKYYDLKTQKFAVLSQDISWNVEEFDLSNEGKVLAFVTNEDGIGRLHLLNLKTRKEMKIPKIPLGQIYALQFSPEGDQLGMVLNTPQTPGDIYVLDIKKKKMVRWTTSEVGGLKTEKFAVPELIHYETFDRVDGKPRMIPAFYYKPKNQDEGPLPVLIQIHGGPESQYRPYFSSNIQYSVNELGIAVLAPNVRGSSGYGKSFLKLDNDYKREDSVKDIGKLLDWIAAQPELDASRVALRGGSYGGYMVLASMIHFDARLRAGIEIVGISNFVTFLENTKAYRRDLRRVEYGDERDPEMRKFLMNISPTTHAHKITKPMFIVQGLNDPRVPVSESEQMVEEIRNSGSPVWYLLAKDEGHGFSKKSNRDYYNNAAALFIEKFLLESAQP
ncbi:S9 family peptidase [candidate division TA06 bacterium]|nr:S9 family peptidase [candidate division TA06 bacterium]